MDKVLTTSKPGSFVLKQLEAINSKNIKKFKEQELILKEQETSILSQRNILTKEEFKKNVDKLKLEIKDYNKKKKITVLEFKKIKLDNTNKLLKAINKILTKYSNDNSISLILQKSNLVVGKSELEITDIIIKIVNNEIKAYKI